MKKFLFSSLLMMIFMSANSQVIIDNAMTNSTKVELTNANFATIFASVATLTAGTYASPLIVTLGTQTYGLQITGAVTKGIDLSGITGTSAIGLILPNGTVDTTGTAVKGAIVFKTSDSNFYGCRATTGKKWIKLNN